MASGTVLGRCRLAVGLLAPEAADKFTDDLIAKLQATGIAFGR